ncbi:protein TIFY 8 isoform X2 [Daucus carota subsp. sativus]|uniref:protein TIFY 8 isoform X2 n=1 Tax=Daucus carota subsp. sativus TaxID=79200 RepID=UPI0007EFBD3F|nr:PREDICTED: protein TIFY 8 isoform X2 [Daucus carota subsp. sativus]
MALLQMMAHTHNNNNNTHTDDIAQDVKPTVFHDFLSKGSDLLPPAGAAPPASAASSGGPRGPISSTSDLASEKDAGNHYEGVPFYGLRRDLTGPEIASRFTRNKRSSLESGYLGSSRDVLQQMQPHSLETSHIMKMFRGTGGPRRPQDEEAFLGMHPTRPTSDSLVLQQATSARADVNASKWERATPISVGPVLPYSSLKGQVVPFGYQHLSTRFKDSNVGPSIFHQAADEGSRTGMKGSGILSSINVSGGTSDRNAPSASNQNSGNRIAETESSTNQQGEALVSRQMTIFYGGQAHVFDDVHPNKADVIMALAGSNGGSWSTDFTQNSTIRPPPTEIELPGTENETGMAINSVFPREFRHRFSMTGNSSHGIVSSNQTPFSPGNIVYESSLPSDYEMCC